MRAEGGPPQLARLTPNVIGTAQYAAPELMNEDLLESMKPDQRYLQVTTSVLHPAASCWALSVASLQMCVVRRGAFRHPGVPPEFPWQGRSAVGRREGGCCF